MAPCKWHPGIWYANTSLGYVDTACASLGTADFGGFVPRFTPCPVLRSSERFALLPGGSLEIGDVAAEDAGTYTCLAENGNDTIEAQAELSVQGGSNI